MWAVHVCCCSIFRPRICYLSLSERKLLTQVRLAISDF